MNETLKVIQTRRSIRKYRPEPIRDEELEEILCAAIYAPSAMNKQNWHFTVVRDPITLTKIKEIMKHNMMNSGIEFLVQRANEPGFVAFHNAPVLIIISGDEKMGFSPIDIGATAENIALAAESLGIGSCLMTSSEILFSADTGGELKKSLGIPADYRHVCAISLGYKDCEQPTPAPRKENLINYV